MTSARPAGHGPRDQQAAAEDRPVAPAGQGGQPARPQPAAAYLPPAPGASQDQPIGTAEALAGRSTLPDRSAGAAEPEALVAQSAPYGGRQVGRQWWARLVPGAAGGDVAGFWWVRRSTVVVDGLFAVGLFVLTTVADRVQLRDDFIPVLLVQFGLVAPLAWRRRAPLLVFGLMSGAAFAQWLADLRLPVDAVLLVALYTVAAYRRPRRYAVMAFVVLEMGIALAALSWSYYDRAAATFLSMSAMATAAGVLGANMRSRRDHLAGLEDRAVRLERERDQQAQLAVAGERARIAREMHDIVTHNLSVMVALADGAVFAQQRTPERATTAMRQVSATGRQAITDMRRFLGVLRADEPDALRHPMPGITELGALTEQVRAAGLPTRLAVAGDPAAVPAAAQLTVYRLVQEALTNTLKHAPAGTRAEVEVGCAADAVSVAVTDDGPAAATADAADDPNRSPGHGLPGMRERAAAYGGALSAGPLPGGGWRVAAVLTLSAPESL